jgi:hypothetical protein
VDFLVPWDCDEKCFAVYPDGRVALANSVSGTPGTGVCDLHKLQRTTNWGLKKARNWGEE